MLPGIKQETHDLSWLSPAVGTWPVPRGCLGSAPRHRGHSLSFQHPAPTMQRRLKPAVSSILLQEAFAHPERLLPTLAMLPFLLVLKVSQISAASGTSQQQQQQHDWWLSPVAPATQTLSASHGKRIAGTESASNQLRANVGERGAIHYSFSLFFSPRLCFFYEKHHPFPPWFPINFAELGCLLPKTLQERGGGEELMAQLCWQRLCVYLCVCRDRGGCTLDAA